MSKPAPSKPGGHALDRQRRRVSSHTTVRAMPSIHAMAAAGASPRRRLVTRMNVLPAATARTPPPPPRGHRRGRQAEGGRESLGEPTACVPCARRQGSPKWSFLSLPAFPPRRIEARAARLMRPQMGTREPTKRRMGHRFGAERETKHWWAPKGGRAFSTALASSGKLRVAESVRRRCLRVTLPRSPRFVTHINVNQDPPNDRSVRQRRDTQGGHCRTRGDRGFPCCPCNRPRVI
jgi:hypothetical protein